MADRGDTHYHLPHLNVWFLVTSLALLATSFWMVIDDWNAPWKKYQREFREIEVTRTRAALASPELQAAEAAEQEASGALEAAQQQLAGHGADVTALEDALRKARAEQFIATEAGKKAKQDHNFLLFEVQEHRAHHDDPDYRGAQVEASAGNLLARQHDQEDADVEVARLERELASLRAAVTQAESRVKEAGKELELMRKKLALLAPQGLARKSAGVVRDLPGLDFVDPSLEVQKLVLADLTNNLNFTVKTRIDMCHTCHVAIDREGYVEEELEQPFRSHPRLDLYLSAKSAHPMSEVGCTICHRGAGEALDFVRVDHRPMAGEEEQRWKEEHHWHKQHHWDWPMLTEEYTEASCVQCHKTSMDLIGEEAPHVYEGYKLVERYGCFRCHKIDWFPTSRRPGPSLANLQAKLQTDFIASWITNPKAFRPTTWMPQIFHLENFAPDQVIVKSDGGKGREIMGDEWSDTAIAAMVAFLLERAPERPLDPIPVEGEAERGRELFRLSGCLGCHNLAPFPGQEARTVDPAFELRGENEHGPNLRGVATKITATWLYHWIRDPHAYWNETRMPDLQLPDQDVADITAYVMEDPDGVFSDVPEGWEQKGAIYDVEVLREQARWLFSREGRKELERRFEGEDPEHRWDDEEELLVAVGEKYVLNQGCFSCHEIPGLEGTQPIGTELSTWGSKTVDKLAWGFIPDELMKQHGWSLDEREEYKEYREHWIEQKLAEPRSFDRGAIIGNPLDRLRMPWFRLTPEQVKAIACFVVGLVEDEVPRAKMQPTSGQLAMDAGLRAIRQKNCTACHVLEPGTVTFRDADERRFTVAAELLPIGDKVMPPAQEDLAAFLADVAAYEEDYEEEVEDVGLRLLEVAPGVGLPGESVFVPRASILDVTRPNGGDFVRVVTGYYLDGIEMFDSEAEEDERFWYWNLGQEGEVEDVDGELRPYFDQPYEKVRWTFAPPVLIDEGYKLQRDWFFAFLNDPVPIRRQIRVKMPAFHFEPGEAESIVDYFANASAKGWPARYSKALRHTLGLQPSASFRTSALPWPEISTQNEGGTGVSNAELAALAGTRTEIVEAIERGYAPDTAASFEKLLAVGAARGFLMNGPVDPAYEWVLRRSPSHLAARGDMVGVGAALATDAEAVNCYQCHWHGGLPPSQIDAPLSWGPDLAMTRERLREPWTENWLWNPGLVYPGTSMPGNFTGDPPQYQAVYPGSNNQEQVQAVLDWLYNFDRAPARDSN